MRWTMLAGLIAVAAPLPAAAQDRMVDITQPTVVVQVLQEEGYKAVLKKNDSGRPYVESAANGSNFTVEFFGCETDKPERGCTSLQF
ncbi:MAG: hypothetical protein WDN44_02535 [Sphingomonas sp.]